MAVVTGFAHTGSIQLTLAITLSHTLNQIGGMPNCHQLPEHVICPSEKATTYIVLVWVLSATMRWSIGYSMLAPQEAQQPILPNMTTQNVETEHPNFADLVMTQTNEDIRPSDLSVKNSKTLLQSSSRITDSDDSPMYIDSFYNRSTIKLRNTVKMQVKPPPKKLSCKQKCMKTMNIPVITSIVSLVIASIPYTKDLFWPHSAIFYSTIMATARFIGSANYILMIIVLGANLSIFKKQKTKLPMKYHYTLVFFRLVIYPWVGIGVIYYGAYWSGIIKDKMMVFVLLLMYATPPANNLMIMATMHKNLESDLARNLLIAYLSSIVTLTLYIALFLYLVEM